MSGLFLLLIGIGLGVLLHWLWVAVELDDAKLSRDYGYDSATGERSEPR